MTWSKLVMLQKCNLPIILAININKNHPNCQLEPDVQTFEVLKQIANSLDENIKVTFDVPSLHANKRVPVLDVKFWVDNNGLVQHSFYKKPYASQVTILQRSAFSAKTKSSSLFQEGLRRLVYNNEGVNKQEVCEIMNEYSNKLSLAMIISKKALSQFICRVVGLNSLVV